MWDGLYGAIPKPLEPLLVDQGRIEDFVTSLRALPPDALQQPNAPAVMRALLSVAAWEERVVPQCAVRTDPHADAMLRRSTRLVQMVHELHKAGYQRIRAIPHESPSGGHWRLNITFSGNVGQDGLTLVDEDLDQRGLVARHTSADGPSWLGWTDAADLNARELAVLFLERYPTIAERGRGRDWLYSGWLTDFLGRMENADELGLLIFSADYPLDPALLEPWMPPPPRLET